MQCGLGIVGSHAHFPALAGWILFPGTPMGLAPVPSMADTSKDPLLLAARELASLHSLPLPPGTSPAGQAAQQPCLAISPPSKFNPGERESVSTAWLSSQSRRDEERALRSPLLSCDCRQAEFTAGVLSRAMQCPAASAVSMA